MITMLMMFMLQMLAIGAVPSDDIIGKTYNSPVTVVSGGSASSDVGAPSNLDVSITTQAGDRVVAFYASQNGGQESATIDGTPMIEQRVNAIIDLAGTKFLFAFCSPGAMSSGSHTVSVIQSGTNHRAVVVAVISGVTSEPVFTLAYGNGGGGYPKTVPACSCPGQFYIFCNADAANVATDPALTWPAGYATVVRAGSGTFTLDVATVSTGGGYSQFSITGGSASDNALIFVGYNR